MQVVYYRAPDGSEPVNEFIEGIADPRKRAALDNQIERLNMLRPNDPPLPFPWSSQLEGEFRELRLHYGSELYRVIYRRSRNLFVLLQMFRKDTGRVPEAELADCARTMGGLQSADGRRAPAAAAGGRPRRSLEWTSLIIIGKIGEAGESKERKSVPQRKSKSPVGSTVSEGARRRARRSAGYGEAKAQLEAYEQLARIVIRRRMELDLTQEQLATRMGTSHSAISRIESGQHSTSVQTLQRLAAALEMRFVMGFEHGPAEKPVRELVPA
jgi:ribosome-binding protein aMBF1 (putative translation factor)/phage-related protein